MPYSSMIKLGICENLGLFTKTNLSSHHRLLQISSVGYCEFFVFTKRINSSR